MNMFSIPDLMRKLHRQQHTTLVALKTTNIQARRTPRPIRLISTCNPPLSAPRPTHSPIPQPRTATPSTPLRPVDETLMFSTRRSHPIQARERRRLSLNMLPHSANMSVSTASTEVSRCSLLSRQPWHPILACRQTCSSVILE